MIEITEDEAKERLDRESTKIIRGVVWKGNGSIIHDGNEKPKHADLDENTRLLVGVLGQFGNRKELARDFGLGYEHVNKICAAKVANHTDSNTRLSKDVEFSKKLEAAKGEVAERALEKVMQSLGLVTNDKLEKIPVKELVEVTKDLSVVVRNVSGAANESRQNVAQVILFAPNSRKEESYETMEIEARVVS